MLQYIEADIPGETTSIAVAKHLLLQLLEKSVGDERLFNELKKAYDASAVNDASNLETMLWEALDIGLNRIAGADNLMIVIDGIDEIKGGDHHAKQLNDRLGVVSSKHGSVQAIVLSSDYARIPKHGKTQKFQITADHTHNDLRHLIEHALRDTTHYKDQSVHDCEAVVEQLLHAAHGNMLWTTLTAAVLKNESSHEGFMKAVKASKESPKSLEETIRKVTAALDFSKTDTNLLLSWMLIAERPLTVTEISFLLQIDLQKQRFVERTVDVKNDIIPILKPLVVLRDGHVRFRHAAIRAHMLKLQIEGKKLRDRRAAQTDLTMRLLAYCKFNLTKSRDPTLEPIDKSEVDDLFTKQPLLDYAVQYWTEHFHASSLYSETGSLTLSTDFKAVFPHSTYFSMLEWACWGPQSSTQKSIEKCDLAIRVRQDVFTEKHESVLQTLIACGSFYRTISKITEAGSCYYRASHIGRSLLNQRHPVVIGCTATFITLTESITLTSRTEFVTRKEEMLKYIIETYKHQYGESHDLVINHYKKLAQLYVEIHEEQKAETIWRELRTIVTTRFGKGSEVLLPHPVDRPDNEY